MKRGFLVFCFLFTGWLVYQLVISPGVLVLPGNMTVDVKRRDIDFPMKKFDRDGHAAVRKYVSLLVHSSNTVSTIGVWIKEEIPVMQLSKSRLGLRGTVFSAVENTNDHSQLRFFLNSGCATNISENVYGDYLVFSFDACLEESALLNLALGTLRTLQIGPTNGVTIYFDND